LALKAEDSMKKKVPFFESVIWLKGRKIWLLSNRNQGIAKGY